MGRPKQDKIQCSVYLGKALLIRVKAYAKKNKITFSNAALFLILAGLENGGRYGDYKSAGV